jgi:dipeptidyl aminopeptidase/acylaminoacyl peptidase
MSPAPRGSTDFGTKFFDLAAGDWGGAETLDDFAAGKFLRDRLGIPAARIGIFGHSRGGYDTMRAMTFPGEVNGVKESFRFGFGIAESGISDIIRAAKGGNISQWYANLTGGDPSKDAAKWNDRSPETHADAISGPLLLTHGSNDQRVPVTESRAMFAKLQQLKKEVYYTELPGQGHGYVGIDAQTQYYRAVFDFLGKLR